MVSFDAIKPGDVLWDCRRQKMGNTSMSRMASWQVKVISKDDEKRTAVCSWNGNKATTYRERDFARLRRTKIAQRKSAVA